MVCLAVGASIAEAIYVTFGIICHSLKWNGALCDASCIGASKTLSTALLELCGTKEYYQEQRIFARHEELSPGKEYLRARNIISRHEELLPGTKDHCQVRSFIARQEVLLQNKKSCQTRRII